MIACTHQNPCPAYPPAPRTLPRRSPHADLYPELEQVESQLKSWANDHPDITQLVSIGKTHENRDIWALKITKDANATPTDAADKPALLITGTTHAREWNTLMTAMNVAHELIDNYPEHSALVDRGEIWVVPCLNPDGYAYTRETDNMWRKNRHPIAPQDTACPQPGDQPIAIGIDLNRNYYDGNPAHATLYRPEGDTPCSTDDDSGTGYDDPTSDNYRGPAGASEKEVSSVVNFFLPRANLRGVIDHHSYGGDIVYPVKRDDPKAASYREACAAMNAAMDKPYKVLAADDIPIPMGYYSGVGEFMWNANNKMGLLVEMGTQFQPDAAELAESVRNVTNADLAFANYLIENAAAQAR
jgi:predicted deacylase